MGDEMSTDIAAPEFASASFWQVINCRSEPWEGVPVTLKHPFEKGDEVTFDVMVFAGYDPDPSTTLHSFTITVAKNSPEVICKIPWEGVLDSVTKGTIRVQCCLKSTLRATKVEFRRAEVSYNRETPEGICTP